MDPANKARVEVLGAMARENPLAGLGAGSGVNRQDAPLAEREAHIWLGADEHDD